LDRSADAAAINEDITDSHKAEDRRIGLRNLTQYRCATKIVWR